MQDHDDRSGRRTRTFWHSFPKDGAWRRCTLEHYEQTGDKFEPICRNCWHKGQVMSGAEVAAWADVPMDTPAIALAARLVCSMCGHPAGYFHLINPAVKVHR